MPELTVILTTYKRPALLRRALQSILNQSYKDFIVYVYDNASGDETEEVVRQLMSQDARIKYHCHDQNIGMMANYEFAFERIATPYFCFLSDDDFILPWFYETAMADLLRFPEAAFAACGVLAVNENFKFVGDPLSFWKKEGLHVVPEGILEMVSSHGKLPIPAGIVFRTEKAKPIKPNWKCEIQLMWDPDYLMQVAAVHPIVVNKKICAVFWAHSEGFSSSFYTQLSHSAEGFEKYLIANGSILTRLQENADKTVHSKEIVQSFKRMNRNCVFLHLRGYIINQNFVAASKSYKTYTNFFGFDFRLYLLYLWAQAGLLSSAFDLVLRSMILPLYVLKYLRRKLKPTKLNIDREELNYIEIYSSSL